jgi:calpain-7
MPVYNTYGKYVVKLWLNGVARRVMVDDRLPVDKYGNMMCSHTTITSVLELWVSIIEKAYMKLCEYFLDLQRRD